MEVLEISPSDLPPRSLRGGGTVYLWDKYKDLGLVLWRGRWQNEKNIAYFLQEALCRRLSAQLTARQRAKILALSRLARKVCALRAR